MDASGRRIPRPLHEWRAWLACFDAVQVNEDELAILASSWGGDPWHFAADVVDTAVQLLCVTLGSRGAAFVASPGFRADPFQWTHSASAIRPAGAATSQRVPPTAGAGIGAGDPTGCGDVWGATCFAALLAGESLEEAIRRANHAAARNVAHHGATGLYTHLVGKLAS
jgi:sugar/nucleoside kinase (ribokinase family)